MTDAVHLAGGQQQVDPVLRLASSWEANRETFVALDLTGRHRHGRANGRFDLTRPRPFEPDEIDAALVRHGYAHLDGSALPRRTKAETLTRLVGTLRELRSGRGRPAWILLDDVQALPPEVPMDLAAGGWCVAARDGSALPSWAVSGLAGTAVRTTEPQLDLVLLPAANAGVRR